MNIEISSRQQGRGVERRVVLVKLHVIMFEKGENTLTETRSVGIELTQTKRVGA